MVIAGGCGLWLLLVGVWPMVIVGGCGLWLLLVGVAYGYILQVGVACGYYRWVWPYYSFSKDIGKPDVYIYTCCLGCVVLLCLVCLTLLASFFLPSHPSLRHEYYI